MNPPSILAGNVRPLHREIVIWYKKTLITFDTLHKVDYITCSCKDLSCPTKYSMCDLSLCAVFILEGLHWKLLSLLTCIRKNNCLTIASLFCTDWLVFSTGVEP